MKRSPLSVFNLLLIEAVLALSAGWWLDHRRFAAACAASDKLQADDDGAEPTKPQQSERQYIPLAGVPKGAANAPITIVEFVDFQCPYCGRATEAIDRVFKEYLGQVRFFVRHSPLAYHSDAPLAARATLAAGEQGRFWQMHDKLLVNRERLSREDIETYAREIGVDMVKFMKALDAQTHQTRVESDMTLAEQVGAKGTPTFFVNGRMLCGAQPFEKFKEVIDEELSQVAELTANGTPAEKLYDVLTAKVTHEATQRLRR